MGNMRFALCAALLLSAGSAHACALGLNCGPQQFETDSRLQTLEDSANRDSWDRQRRANDRRFDDTIRGRGRRSVGDED